MDEKIIARFWAKVDKDGPEHPYDPWLGNCWMWQGRPRDGYGIFSVSAPLEHFQKRQIKAHRFSWSLVHGPFPEWCEVICHSCDVRNCVSPTHLFAGTRRTNDADMRAKGREFKDFARHLTLEARYRGSRHHSSKLNDADVIEMRRQRAEDGISYMELGRRFGVRDCSARSVCLGHHRRFG